MLRNDFENMMEAALYYSECGIKVIPVSHNKKPLVEWRGLGEREQTAGEIEALWRITPTANIGALTGYGWIVVDADNDIAIEFVRANFPWTPVTVKTPRGMHFYYSSDEEIRNDTSKIGVDVRGTGGFIILPPSKTANGDYRYVEPPPEISADLYHDLPKISRQHLAVIHTVDTNGNPVTYPTASKSWDMSKISVPASGDPVSVGQRNQTAASLAGQFISRGDSFTQIWQKLRAWNETNSESLEDEELARVAHSVAQTHLHNNPEATIEFDTPEEDTGPFSIYQYSRISKVGVELPEIWWGDNAIFERSRVLISGAPKAGKSEFFLSMAVAATTSGDFLGSSFLRPLRVVWLQAEIHKSFVMLRINHYVDTLPDEKKITFGNNFYFTGRSSVDLADILSVREITAQLDKIDPDIICYDPFSNFIPTINENDNGEIQSILKVINRIEERYNASTIIIHHNRKAINQDDPFSGIRGASALRGWYDTGIVLVPSKVDGISVMNMELRNAKSPAPQAIKLNRDSMTYSYVSVADDNDWYKKNKPLQMVDYIFGILGRERLSFADLRKTAQLLFDCSDRTAERHIKKAIDDGLLEKVVYGDRMVYSPPTTVILPSKKHPLPTTFDTSNSEDFD